MNDSGVYRPECSPPPPQHCSSGKQLHPKKGKNEVYQLFLKNASYTLIQTFSRKGGGIHFNTDIFTKGGGAHGANRVCIFYRYTLALA